MVKGFNKKLFFKTLFVLIAIFLVSFLFAFIKAEGGNSAFIKIMATPSVIFAFPFFWLSYEVKFLQHPIFLSILIGLDVLIYALIIERIFYVKSKK